MWWWIVFLWMWGPLLAALTLALVLRAFAVRVPLPLPRGLAVLFGIAGGLPVLAYTVMVASGIWNPEFSFDPMLRALVPLGAGLLGLLVLMIPAPAPRTTATASVSRRTVTAFLPRGWVIVALAVTAAIVALSIAAGLASTVDDRGRYTEYSISIGTTGTEMGSAIYGWYYSRPALVALGVLLLAAAIAWLLISRPAWGDDADADAARRHSRVANVGRVLCGALLVHLAYILQSLAGTASIAGFAMSTDLGTVSARPPFAALESTLQVSGYLVLTAGLTLWVLTALTSAPWEARRFAGAGANAGPG